MWLQWCIHTCEWNYTVSGTGAEDAVISVDRNDKQAIFKSCPRFTDCITEIINTQVDRQKILIL